MTNIKWVLFDVQSANGLYQKNRESFNRVMGLFMDLINGQEIDFEPLTDDEYTTLKSLINRLEQGRRNWTDYSKQKKQTVVAPRHPELPVGLTPMAETLKQRWG